ncbi:hypothetical protein TrRE_jg11936 [Triparma retinervis]|uniref:Signal recognition particle SRP54 subunit M-domain domain-containing protein n=1 Tax=Triparma retinervis TaxID=2557542 RepID=A0A9W7G7Y2_9STRA|nr:hypothetical protein TrRE_jg11936 [Triparma retinervis]
MGLVDMVTGKLQDRKERQETDKFKEEMEKMLKSKSFTLKTFISDIDSSLSSWQVKLSGVTGGSKEVKALKDMKATLEAIHGAVGNKSLFKLGRREKLLITAKSGKSMPEINEVIESFRRMKTMHSWMRERKERGDRMPSNQDEAQEMMMIDMKKGLVGGGEEKSVMEKVKRRSMRRAGRT